MKSALLRQAREAFQSSLKGTHLDQELVKKQLVILNKAGTTERLALLRSYKNLVEKKLSEETIQVFAGSTITESEKEKLTKSLESRFGKDKKVNFNFDPNLIGGLKVKEKDTLYDYTVAGKLEMIKEAFV